MKYTYEMHPTEKPLNATYNRKELEQLTTIQLREICIAEKLVIGVAYKLDRKHLIETIMKYRGEKLTTFVDSYENENFKKVTGIFKKFLNFNQNNKNFYIPTKITIYKNSDVTFDDNYVIDGEKLYEGNALLINDNREIIGILNLRKNAGKHYLTYNHLLIHDDLGESLFKNYYIGFLDELNSKYLYNFYYHIDGVKPTKLNCTLVPIKELLVTRLESSDLSLVIDFGTSNTSIGAYLDEYSIKDNIKDKLITSGINLNEINKVKFSFKGSRKFEEFFVYPTVIGIKDCSDKENIVYRFGYDAIKAFRRHSYNNLHSTFHGIKKWINDYEKVEEVSDEEGNIAFIPRKTLLREYFLHIINLAEQQHRCKYKKLHITSPVKQKVQFINMYKDILHDFEIEEKFALDEGISVLYNSIYNQIEKKNFEEHVDYNALIVDCGGGTTDLSNCSYFIRDNQITYELNMTTTYANGETNFGGNNITFRIMQYLKILFANYYTNSPYVSVEELLNCDVANIYRYVDSGNNDIYGKLEELYNASEEVIPTKFYYYKDNPSSDYMKVKSNFHFLWNLAEQIKVSFYETVHINETSFHEYGLKKEINENKIYPEESWRINIFSDNNPMRNNRNILQKTNKKLKLITEFPQIVITKEELNTLIKADIYKVIKNFLEPLYLDGQLNQFSFIKLTGQTCKIDIFRDALKEFIAGRIIETAKKEKTVQDYKLVCLEGAVKYQNSKKIGLVAPIIKNEAPIMPYKLVAFTHAGNENVMMFSLEQLNKNYGFISRNIDTESIELLLKNSDDDVIHKYSIRLRYRDFSETTYEETTSKYGEKIPQDDIDSIIDDEIKLFTFAFEDKWGFYAVPIARKDGILLLGNEKYFPFENDEWELDFFDGRR